MMMKGLEVMTCRVRLKKLNMWDLGKRQLKERLITA